MAWQRYTLDQVRSLNRDAVVGKLRSGAILPNSVLRVLADSNAGLAYLVLQYIDWLSTQFLPDTAEDEWLRRHAKIWLGGWNLATYANGTLAFTGIEGAVIPSGSRLAVTVGSLTVQIQTTADLTLHGSPATGSVAARALTAGSIGNLEDDTQLALQSAIAGVDAVAIASDFAGGADEEDDDSLRARVLERIRKPPMGGDADDYVAWAKTIPGVTRAWCSPNEVGAGTVTIRFMMDNLRATDDGFPNDDDVAAVQEYIDSVRPVAVKGCFVRAPLAENITFAVASLSPDTVTMRNAFSASVAAMIKDRAAPARAVQGIRVASTTIYAAWVSEAGMQAAGVDHFDLTMSDHPMPYNGSLAVLGTITWPS